MKTATPCYRTEVNGEDVRVYWTASDVNDGDGFQAVIDRVVREDDGVDITAELDDDELNALSDEIELDREHAAAERKSGGW